MVTMEQHIVVSKSPQNLKLSVIEMFEQKPLSVCCVDIARIAEYCTLEHLVAVFPTILENIFDFYGRPGNKWKLLHFTKSNLPTTDYVAVCDLLSPQGPLFKIMYRLLTLPSINMFRFCALDSVPVERHSQRWDVNQTYLHASNPNTIALFQTPMLLNAFDFFMCHLAFCLVNPARRRFDEWYRENTMLYFTVCVNYWHHFLPLDNVVILSIEEEMRAFHILPDPRVSKPEAVSTLSSQHSGSMLFKLSPEARKRISSNNPNFPSSPLLDMKMFKIPSLNEVSALPDVVSNIDLLNDSAVWRSESLLRICCELWLNVYYVKNVQSSSLEESVAGSDVQRMIRAFIKHMHCFSFRDSNGVIKLSEEQPLTPRGGSYCEHFTVSLLLLKQKMHLDIVQPNMYHFLLRNLMNSPVDTSYRLILETWLSYIQPWRYVEAAGYSVSEDRSVHELWEQFLSASLGFYTQFFHAVLSRLTETNISSELKALLVFRVTKILSLPNLSTLLARAEETYMSGKEVSILNQTGYLPLIMAHVNRCIGTTEYIPLYNSGASLSKVKHYMSNVKALYLDLRKKKELGKTVASDHGLHIFQPITKLYNWLVSESVSSEYSDAQVLAHLKEAHQKLSANFAVQDQNLEDSFDEIREKSDLSGDSRQRGVPRLCRDLDLNDDVITSTPISTNSAGRAYTGISRASSPEPICSEAPEAKSNIKLIPQTRMDPELMAARPWELQLLVTLFYGLTHALHQRYGVLFNRCYYRSDLVGFLVQPFLTAPPARHHRQQGTKVQHDYPPRVSLRFLASYYTLLLVACTVCYCRLSSCNLLITILTAAAMCLWCKLYEYFVHCAQIFG